MTSLTTRTLHLVTFIFFISAIPARVAATTNSTLYPTQSQIAETFNYLATGNYTAFFSQVAPNVNWTVMGTHPLAGQYNNRTIFETDTITRLENTVDPQHPFEISVVNIVGGGNEAWSVQELHVQAICKNGLIFDNRYAWTTRWDTSGIIVEVRAYLDSALVARAITENESGEYTYTDQKNSLIPGPVGIGCTNTAGDSG